VKAYARTPAFGEAWAAGSRGLGWAAIAITRYGSGDRLLALEQLFSSTRAVLVAHVALRHGGRRSPVGLVPCTWTAASAEGYLQESAGRRRDGAAPVPGAVRSGRCTKAGWAMRPRCGSPQTTCRERATAAGAGPAARSAHGWRWRKGQRREQTRCWRTAETRAPLRSAVTTANAGSRRRYQPRDIYRLLLGGGPQVLWPGGSAGGFDPRPPADALANAESEEDRWGLAWPRAVVQERRDQEMRAMTAQPRL